MSSTLLEKPAPPKRRWPVPRLSRDPETRSVQVGILATILIHLLMIVLLPYIVLNEPDGQSFMGSEDDAGKNFEIEISPEMFEPEAPPPPLNFVETNPDAPDNVPDQTQNFAAQNQQAAQEEPDPTGQSDRAATEGKKDFESNAIVSGRLEEPTPPMPAAPPTPPTTETSAESAQTPVLEQNPLPGFEKQEGENTDGFGSNVAKTAENSEPVPERVEGARDVPLVQGTPGQQLQIDPRRPQPRPRLERQVRPAVLADRPVGTANIGLTGIDARWSEYGQYLQKLIETVQVQWERIIIQSSTYPPPGSVVTVTFRLESSEGGVSEIVKAEGTGGSQAQYACVSAITARAPYGKWSEQMIAVLGTSQELTFTFFYQ